MKEPNGLLQVPNHQLIATRKAIEDLWRATGCSQSLFTTDTELQNLHDKRMELIQVVSHVLCGNRGPLMETTT